MPHTELARIISAELDNGDNRHTDGIQAIDKVARAIAEELPTDKKQDFLTLCGLY